MNNFANSLLHVMLSWMRALFSDLLHVFQGGDTGLIAWLSRHWIFLAILLIAAGIAIDGFIYVLRWRPQYVWRTRLRALRRRREAPDPEEEQFEEGFDTGLPDFDFVNTPIPGLRQPQPEPEPILESYYVEAEAAAQEMQPEEIEIPAEAHPEGRRRRTERHARRFPAFLHQPRHGRRNRRGELPIDPRAAFHEPVYPADDARPSYFTREDEDNQNV